MALSLTHLLLLIELGFLAGLAVRWRRQAAARVSAGPVILYLAWLALFGTVTTILGANGMFISDALLRWLPALWLQLISVAAIVGPVVAVPTLRRAAREIVDATPWHWFAALQALRIGALGTAYKTAVGEFPLSFELIVGVPDLLFGLSALWVGWLARHGRISARGFMRWNVLGMLAIVPAAPLVLQLGLPGPLNVFNEVPDARAVFTYPMSIAPMIGVPLFVAINGWVAWRLWERLRGERAVDAVVGAS